MTTIHSSLEACRNTMSQYMSETRVARMLGYILGIRILKGQLQVAPIQVFSVMYPQYTLRSEVADQFYIGLDRSRRIA